MLASLELPDDPEQHLAERAAHLDATYREVAERLSGNTAVRFDEHGRLHLKALPAEAEPPSLENLRALTSRMLPRVDLPELLLEVFAWTGADEAFTSITGGEACLADLTTTVAALLVGEACNVGWQPVVKPGVPALTRDRLSHSMPTTYAPRRCPQPTPRSSRLRPTSSGELRQRYYEGMEDQLGALGLVLNAIVLFNTRYLDAAISQLRAEGYEVRDEDAARLSPFVRHHINMLGRYSFLVPELAGGLRSLRDPSDPDEDDE